MYWLWQTSTEGVILFFIIGVERLKCWYPILYNYLFFPGQFEARGLGDYSWSSPTTFKIAGPQNLISGHFFMHFREKVLNLNLKIHFYVIVLLFSVLKINNQIGKKVHPSILIYFIFRQSLILLRTKNLAFHQLPRSETGFPVKHRSIAKKLKFLFQNLNKKIHKIPWIQNVKKKHLVLKTYLWKRRRKVRKEMLPWKD